MWKDAPPSPFNFCSICLSAPSPCLLPLRFLLTYTHSHACGAELGDRLLHWPWHPTIYPGCDLQTAQSPGNRGTREIWNGRCHLRVVIDRHIKIILQSGMVRRDGGCWWWGETVDSGSEGIGDLFPTIFLIIVHKMEPKALKELGLTPIHSSMLTCTHHPCCRTCATLNQ